MISRRAILRGALGGSIVGLGLPLLEQMLNTHGTALAAGTALPKRYGLFFWGEGLPPNYRHNATTAAEANQNVDVKSDQQDFWTPTTTGTDWQMTDLLTPLAKHKANINVVTGLDVKTEIPADPPGQNDGHQRGTHRRAHRRSPAIARATTRPRASPRSKGRRSISSSPSIPSFIPTALRAFDRSSSAWARHFWPRSALGSPARTAVRTCSTSPFEIRSSSTTSCSRYRLTREKRGDGSSVLDAVAEDTKRLMTKLGARDRQRIDEHLTHINAIEQRLRKGQGGCTVPPAPAAFPARPFGADTGGADFKGEVYNMDKLDAMTDVLVAALRCDLTRVFTILFTPPGSLITMNAAGQVNGPGSIQTHDAAHANNHDILMALTRYHMTAFAKLLDKLAAEIDVNGQTLLDSSCIFGTSEFGEGFTTASSRCR